MGEICYAEVDSTVAKGTCQICFALASFTGNENIDCLINIGTCCQLFNPTPVQRTPCLVVDFLNTSSQLFQLSLLPIASTTVVDTATEFCLDHESQTKQIVFFHLGQFHYAKTVYGALVSHCPSSLQSRQLLLLSHAALEHPIPVDSALPTVS